MSETVCVWAICISNHTNLLTHKRIFTLLQKKPNEKKKRFFKPATSRFLLRASLGISAVFFLNIKDHCFLEASFHSLSRVAPVSSSLFILLCFLFLKVIISGFVWALETTTKERQVKIEINFSAGAVTSRTFFRCFPQYLKLSAQSRSNYPEKLNFSRHAYKSTSNFSNGHPSKNDH